MLPKKPEGEWEQPGVFSHLLMLTAADAAERSGGVLSA